MYENALIEGNIKGDKKIWFVGTLFTMAGIICALIVPRVITPVPGSQHVLSQGQITGFVEDDSGSRAPIFSYKIGDTDTRTAQGWIWSNKPAYKQGDSIEVYYEKDSPDKVFIAHDRDLAFVNVFLYILGGYFLLIGVGILAFKIRKIENVKIEVLFGALAAFSYGIPATLALPALYYAYAVRPNFLFDAELNAFPSDSLLIGSIFTVTGILINIGLYFLLRYYKKTGSNTVGTL